MSDCPQPRDAQAIAAGLAGMRAAGLVDGERPASRCGGGSSALHTSPLLRGAGPVPAHRHKCSMQPLDLPVSSHPTRHQVSLGVRSMWVNDFLSKCRPFISTEPKRWPRVHRYFLAGAGKGGSRGGPDEDAEGAAPGQLGPELREALRIGALDPPPWLNRMRQLGVPPGITVLQYPDPHYGPCVCLIQSAQYYSWLICPPDDE